MAKPIVKRLYGKRHAVLILVIATTIFAITASGLKAMDDNRFGDLHTISQVVLVATYAFYLYTLSRAKNIKSVSIAPMQQGESFLISPSWPNQVLCLTDSVGIGEKIKTLKRLPLKTRQAIRGIVAHNAAVNLNFVRLLALFPQIVALDVQGSNVDSDVWDELAHFEHLRLILAHGAVSEDDVRNLSLTLPEIQICIEPSQLQTELAR